jgi:DNA-binding Xre family transcriptional regulator
VSSKAAPVKPWLPNLVGTGVSSPLTLRWRSNGFGTGKLPQFELCETSNIFDLYVPLGLGPEALSRLIFYEVDSSEVYQCMIDEYCPLVAQCLSEGEWRLEPNMVARVAPIVTELLLRQTKSQMRLVDEMTASSPTLSKLKASKVRKMNKSTLLAIATKYSLDIDIRKFTSTKRKADAVIAGLAALGLLKE